MPKPKHSTKLFEPTPDQVQAIDLLLNDKQPNVGLLWDPGSPGKTAPVLHAIATLIKKKKVDSALIVATKNIVSNTWPAEVRKWGLPLRISKILGNEKSRLKAMKEEAEVYVTNYESLIWLADNWKKNNFGKVMLVADESHLMKNTSAKRFKKMKPIFSKFSRRVILTGSPTPRSFEDLFGQIYILDLGDSLGQYITHFRNSYFNAISFGAFSKYQLRRGADKEIYDQVGHLIHRATVKTKLPKLIVRDVIVKLPPDAMKIYVSQESGFVSSTPAGLLTSSNNAGARMKLRQIASGNVYRQELDDMLKEGAGKVDREVVHIHDAKIEALMDILVSHQEIPCYIGYEFRHEGDALIKAMTDKSSPVYPKLPKHKGKPMVPTIGSGTKDADVQKYIKWWNEGAIPVLLAQSKAGSLGLNLQGVKASVVFYSFSEDFPVYDQFPKRVLRKGQKHDVVLYRLIAENTIDEDIAKASEEKGDRQEAFLKAMEERTAKRYGKS